jgi:hypothetical protein
MSKERLTVPSEREQSNDDDDDWAMNLYNKTPGAFNCDSIIPGFW